MKHCIATSAEAEHWKYAGDSVEDAEAEGRIAYEGREFWIAAEQTRTDEQFFDDLTNAILANTNMDEVDVYMAEKNWVNAQEYWFAELSLQFAEGLTAWLKATFKRPTWRNVEVVKHVEKDMTGGGVR